MSFFIKNKRRKANSALLQVNSKRKPSKVSGEPVAKKTRKGRALDEEIESDSDLEGEELSGSRKAEYSSDEVEEEETAPEKKLRLAKQYLSRLEVEEADKREDDEIHKDIISHRLKQDLLEQTGRLQRQVADNYLSPTTDDITVLRGHQLSVTCVVISPDSKHIFSGSKDCSIVKWCVETGRKVHTIPGGRKGTENKHVGHTGHVLCIAISSDGNYLASGDRNKLIHIWNPGDCQLIHTFRGHRDAVSGLSFRKGSHQLFSASHDRTVKIWNLDEMAYVETLFGHQDSITAIDSLTRERAVTSGGRDGSVRIWKVIEESQLVFHGHSGSIDTVSLINESNFVTGGDDNSISVWGVMKKKPMVTVSKAHCGTSTNGNKLVSEENWITAVASFQHSDLIASAGSKDGSVRLWKCGADFKSLHPVFSIPITGFVNSLQFSKDGSFLVAGIGQEHRLGRWWRIKEAKNGLSIIRLRTKPDS